MEGVVDSARHTEHELSALVAKYLDARVLDRLLGTTVLNVTQSPELRLDAGGLGAVHGRQSDPRRGR